jgi:beta-mannosidase
MEKLNLTKKTNESGTANAADTRIKSTHKAAEALATIDLCGTWQLRQVGNDRTLSGKVPGCVHLDLLSAVLIEDPFYRDNELKVQWLSEETSC